MGDYNPHTPYILGQEWVGIRDESLTFEPTVNTVEQGHRFTLATPTQVSQARAYINDLASNGGNGSVVAVSIYPAGSAEDSGPIRVVDIPVLSVAISGDTVGGTASITTVGAPTAQGALFAEGTDSYVNFAAQADFRWITCLFDISRFAGLIKDKRILNIQLMYTANCATAMLETDPTQNFGIANSIINTNVNFSPNASPFSNNTPFLGRIIARPDDGYIADLGELNYHFSGQTPSANINAAPDRMNWSYAELIRLAGLASPFIYVIMGVGQAAGAFQIYFVGLRITYCEEQRVLYGASGIGSSFNNAWGRLAVPGAFIVPLRSPTTMAANVVLAAGTYDVVVSSAQQATPIQPVGASPKFNALRQLYSMPAHPPIQTTIPFPLDNAIGQQFTERTTTILPQLSLHTTGGTIVAPHAYGRQAAAQVYGANTAIQDIYDVPVGGAATFQQVRYYARRYGDTTQSLVLSTTSPTISGSTVSITPTEFDALSEIVDGWKAVTLRFASPPSMGTGIIPRWMWSSVGETAGNRWEVLGVSSHAITAVPSNALTLVASPNQTSTATYGQPISGSVVDFDWMPGLAPLVTGTTDDPSADAVLIFSQDPPTITGVVVSVLSQAVTGFTECATSTCCVPSAISYNRVVWTTTTLPTTGFGAYELQRQDPVERVWETIMLATNPAITGFNDYEARVGVTSSYQIRQSNVLNFNGAWSVTGTGAITEPGVTLPSCGTNKRGVLIFTSNEDQTGLSNLAYAMTWDDSVVEDFSFNEAGTVDIQRHHDRDFQVAFHGAERGGETFSRRLLLSNAAIALPRLGNTRALRDLAWDDFAYVCVRDDIGDRWLATIIVSRTEVRRKRRLYNADITVVEVTDTPTPVNP